MARCVLQYTLVYGVTHAPRLALVRGGVTGCLDEQHGLHTPAAAERTGGMGQRSRLRQVHDAAHAANDSSKNPAFCPVLSLGTHLLAHHISAVVHR